MYVNIVNNWEWNHIETERICHRHPQHTGRFLQLILEEAALEAKCAWNKQAEFQKEAPVILLISKWLVG